MARFMGLVGILTMIGLAYAFSTNRRAIRIKTLLWGLSLQFAFAVIVLRLDAGREALQVAGNAVTKLLSYSFAGSEFVFGELGKNGSKFGMVFAFQVLTTIIFVSAFFTILYHFGIMQFVIKQVAKVMKLMGASGAESLNVAASIFMGQTEAPLCIRPFLPFCTRSEIMTIMTAGMAHVSGGILGAYILYGIEAKHLLAAVIMTAPGTILLAKMLVPETETPVTSGTKADTSTVGGSPALRAALPTACIWRSTWQPC
jgi:CNT family concentrative nucleoside transporter